MVHFNRLYFSGDLRRRENNNHTGLNNTSLNTSNRDCSNTTNLVHILQRKTKRLICGTSGWLNGVNGLQKSLSSGISSLGLLGPSLEPRHVFRGLQHVVAVPSRDWNKCNSLGVVSDLLDEARHFLDDFIESLLGVLVGVHLVDSNDKLLDTKGECKKGMLTRLTILGDTG